MHVWTGLFIAVPVCALIISGTLLQFSDGIVRMRLPDLAGATLPTSAATISEDLERIELLVADAGWQVIRLPQPGWPIYQVWLGSGEQAYLLSGADRFVDRFQSFSRPETFLYEMHAHLLAGDTGKWVARVVSLLIVGMMIAGAILWWPSRRRFNPADVLPRGATRPKLLRSHATLAILLLPLLTFTLTTAVAMAYPNATKSVLASVFGRTQIGGDDVIASRQAGPYNWLAIISSAEDAFPNDRLVYLIRPAKTDQPLRIRTRVSGEWHPNGRSIILVRTDDGRVLYKENANEYGLDLRVANAIYPMHSARGSGVWLMPVSIASGLGLAGVLVLGIWSYLKRLQAARVASRADL